MTEKDDKPRRPLDRLKDALLEDILNMSEDELLEEAKEDGIDPAQHAAKMKHQFGQVLLTSKKARMAAARVGAAKIRHSNSDRFGGEVVDMTKARARLRAAINRGSSLGLTMAARQESELSDADVLSQLQDLVDLGLVQPDDENDQ